MKQSFIAIDIETTGLHPKPWDKNCKIFCISVATAKGTLLYEPKDFYLLKPVLEDKTVKKVIHNAIFDALWIKRMLGWDVRNIWCTRLAEQVLIGQNLPRSEKSEVVKQELSSSLKYTLRRYGLADLDKSLGTSFTGGNRDPHLPLTKDEKLYAINDVKFLLPLQAMQEYRLAKMDLMRVMNLENSLVEKLILALDRGVGFNEETWVRIAHDHQSAYNSIIKRLPSTVGNWNSPTQVKKYFQSIGIPLNSLQEVDELAPVYGNPVLNLFAKAREIYQSTTTFGLKWLQDDLKGATVDPDKRVRALIEQILNTGRLAFSHPNLLQLPRDTHGEALVPTKGHVFIAGDFSSQEIGIVAAGSKEETWIKAILRGDDIHSLTASMVMTEEWLKGKEKGCTFPKKCKCKEHLALREKAKVTNFTIIYGGGPGNIAKKNKMSMKDAQKLIYRFVRATPKLSRWLGENAKSAVTTRISYSADPFKRRRTLRDPEDWMLSNIGKNNPIQSCGANMIKLSMVSLPDWVHILLPIHDELIVEVKKSEAQKAVKALKAVMEKAADYCTGVPGLIKVEPKILTSLKKVK